MKYRLLNDKLSATINSVGAELTSLKKNDDSREYIWNANPDFWGRHAPVLFPVVGRLKDDQFTYQGKKYHLKLHGFARNLEFVNLKAENDQVVFELVSNDKTLEVYPFHFKLRVTYTLSENFITTTYRVYNSGVGEMLFSIGGHPGFNCPADVSEKRANYFLEFQTDEDAPRHILKNGTISAETRVAIVDKKIQLTENLFDEDALIFKGLKSDYVSLKDKTGRVHLRFHFPGFPYLGIWSVSRNSPYVCIEPWFGIADNHDHDGELVNKEGIMKLQPESHFECEYKIEIV